MLPIPMRFTGITTYEFPQGKTPSVWVVNPISGRWIHTSMVLETDDDREYAIAVRFSSKTVHFYIPPGLLTTHPSMMPSSSSHPPSTGVFGTPPIATTTTSAIPTASLVTPAAPEGSPPSFYVHCPHCSHPFSPIPTAGDPINGCRTTREWTARDRVVINSEDEEEEDDPSEASGPASSESMTYHAGFPPRKRLRFTFGPA